METKDVLKSIRMKHNLTQEEMAEKLAVTRQAVSRWENGDSTPNIDTLKQISIAFDVSINTLLGSPRKLLCQCCSMPLEDDMTISRETDQSFNEDYCKWCYADGQFVYKSMDELLDFLAEHMTNENFTAEQARSYFSEQLPKLKHWKG
ncbi:MAG: helix-turn-helix domain-containing protein [Clostridiales bacterium]|nr:helix-turn-helix domain-containing protein [Clostridiales bacterium]